MTDREAFEAWLTPRRGKICPPHPEDYWEVWQAALAQRTEPQQQDAMERYCHIELPGVRAALSQQAEPVALDRWGIKSVPGRPEDYWFEKMPDGYWTPWHIANEALQRAAPPAVQAEPVACSYCGMRSGHLAACQRPPADDEAVRLLTEVAETVPNMSIELERRINAYLERVGK